MAIYRIVATSDGGDREKVLIFANDEKEAKLEAVRIFSNFPGHINIYDVADNPIYVSKHGVNR